MLCSLQESCREHALERGIPDGDIKIQEGAVIVSSACDADLLCIFYLSVCTDAVL